MERLVVVAAVVRDGDHLLVCRRAPWKSAGGKWEFPGGKVEPGEAPEHALTREIQEELGVAVNIGQLIITAVTPVGNVEIQLSSYRSSLRSGRPTTSSDHDQIGWFKAEELIFLDWAEPDLPTVQVLTAHL